MYLYKRGKIWWVEYQVGGARYRKSTHSQKKSVAEAWVASISKAREMPTLDEAITVLKMLYHEKDVGGIPLEAAWETYLDLAKSVGKDKLSDSTVKARRLSLAGLVTWIRENWATVTTVEGVSGAVAAKYAAHLLALGKKSKTRINIISNLSTIWTMLKNTAPRAENHWATLRPSNTDGKRIDPFTAAQERTVLASAKKVGKDWYPICVIARHTGLRYEDIALLSRGEVSFADGVIRLDPKKTSRHNIDVVIPMLPEVAKVLNDQTNTGDYFFPVHAHYYGDNSQRRQAVLSFREVLQGAGLYGKGNFTFHSWRHTAATRLAASGADIETRKRILGHTVDATARRYDHDEHLEETKTALERAAKVR